jgi:hypothetical protein
LRSGLESNFRLMELLSARPAVAPARVSTPATVAAPVSSGAAFTPESAVVAELAAPLREPGVIAETAALAPESAVVAELLAPLREPAVTTEPAAAALEAPTDESVATREAVPITLVGADRAEVPTTEEHRSPDDDPAASTLLARNPLVPVREPIAVVSVRVHVEPLGHVSADREAEAGNADRNPRERDRGGKGPLESNLRVGGSRGGDSDRQRR